MERTRTAVARDASPASLLLVQRVTAPEEGLLGGDVAAECAWTTQVTADFAVA